MSDIEEIHELLLRLSRDHEELASRVERTFRFGRVLEAADVDVSDPTAPRARIHVDDDEDGQPVKSPWLPYATIAGARNQHSAPSQGQQFLLIAPDGDHEAGLLVPLGHSKLFPSPSTDPAVYVDGAGATDRRFKDGKDRTGVGQNSEHLIVDGAQRITVKDITQLVIKFGGQAYNLQMSALQPAGDIPDF